MQCREFPISARAQVPAGHVDVEDYVTLVLPLADVIIRHADGQRPLLAVVHRCIAKQRYNALNTCTRMCVCVCFNRLIQIDCKVADYQNRQCYYFKRLIGEIIAMIPGI